MQRGSSRSLDDLQRETGGWAARTFPTSTGASIVAHLGDEVGELAEAVAAAPASDPALEAEAADCLLLLLDLAERLGFSLAAAAERKFMVVQHRQHGPPDARGVIHHLPTIPREP